VTYQSIVMMYGYRLETVDGVKCIEPRKPVKRRHRDGSWPKSRDRNSIYDLLITSRHQHPSYQPNMQSDSRTLLTNAGSSSSSSNGKPDRLYVGNLSPSVDEYTLIQVFQKYGQITKLDFMFHKTGVLKGKPRGYAFVEFSNKDVRSSAP
jgi:hypothetical protein